MRPKPLIATRTAICLSFSAADADDAISYFPLKSYRPTNRLTSCQGAGSPAFTYPVTDSALTFPPLSSPQLETPDRLTETASQDDRHISKPRTDAPRSARSRHFPRDTC